MKLSRRIVILGALIVASAAYAYGATCPIDNLGMVFTGKARTEMGKLLYEYRCPSGHVTWVVQ